jgi:hypothetical protein
LRLHSMNPSIHPQGNLSQVTALFCY